MFLSIKNTNLKPTNHAICLIKDVIFYKFNEIWFIWWSNQYFRITNKEKDILFFIKFWKLNEKYVKTFAILLKTELTLINKNFKNLN